MPWAAGLWLTVAIACLAGSIGGRWLLNRLASNEPEPKRQVDQIALEVSRLLLAPEVTTDSLKTLMDLWMAKPALGADDYLNGSLLAEHAGNPDEARIWLALEALLRGDRTRTRDLLTGTGVDLAQLESLTEKDGSWLTETPLGQRLSGSIAGQ